MGNKSALDVYEELSAEGEYKISAIDYDVIRKIIRIAIEDKEYVDFLLQQKKVNYRIIYNIYYDALRELCGALVRLEGRKISNHQGCFAYTCVNFPKLRLDWRILEKIRTIRNKNQYEGSDITKKDWHEIEIEVKLYISKIKKKLEIELDKVKDESTYP